MRAHGSDVFGTLDRTEVVFAEDGSNDGSPLVLEHISRQLPCPVQIVHSDARLGKGGGFTNGFKHAKGEFVILYDCDVSVSPDQLGNLVEKIREGYDIVIGCRNAPGSKILTYPTFTRLVYGKVLYVLAKILFFIPFKETQCGFKIFRKKRVLPIIKDLKLSGWLFDLELLLRAYHDHFKIAEISVVYQYLKESNIHNIKDPLLVIYDLILLRAKILHYYLILPRWGMKIIGRFSRQRPLHHETQAHTAYS